MANPNIKDATTIVANNSLIRLADTIETQLVTNASSSNKVFFIDSIYVANVNGTGAADITISVYASATNSGTATRLLFTVSVPADATLVPVIKDGTIVLKEDMSIYATAGVGNYLHVITNWKEVS